MAQLAVAVKHRRDYPRLMPKLASPSPRVIGPGSAMAIVAGSMLGIGIYLAPAEMAVQVRSPAVLLAIWLGTGLIMLGGALAFAELATRFPDAGGDYVYLRQAFGPSAAFATGWGLFAAVFAGSVAAVTVALCRFQLSTLLGGPLDVPWLHVPGLGAVSGDRVVAVAIVFLLTALNVRGVRLSAAVQNATTVVPALILAVLALICLALATAGALPPGEPAALPDQPLSLTILVRAYLLAYFAYSGWNAVVYVAGEVREPRRTLPRALVGGTVLITLLYVLLCAGFVVALGMGGLASAGEAGSATAAALLGEPGRLIMTVLIALCLLSPINAAILGGARVAWAMAADGAFWRRASRLHPRHGTPAFALWVQALWASVLIVSGGFDELLRAVSVAMLATASLAVIALWVLRRGQAPAAPFQVPRSLGWLPVLFVLASAVAIVQQLVDALSGEPGARLPLIGLVIIGGAWLGHRLMKRRTQPDPPP